MSDAPTLTNDETGPVEVGAAETSAAEPTPADVDAILAAAEGVGRRRWPLLLLGAALGAAGTLAVTTYRGEGDEEAAPPDEELDLATAPVEQRDLLEEIEWSGNLGYGDPVTVQGSGGVVTSAATTGTILERGDELASVDAAPIVVFYGTTPPWRTLSEGSEGVDVRQLEANLATLGYDPDATVDIDETFTAATEAMVERWQEDIGREVTGVVERDDVVVVAGPASVVTMAEVGSPVAGPLATLAPRRMVTDVVAELDGSIDGLARVGTIVEAGLVLYRIDDVPVVALATSDPVAAAMLDDTFTDLELEQALRDEGHDPDEAMTVDGVITDATERAIERWQQVAGLPVTGSAEPGHYAMVPTGHVVEGHLVEAGAELVTGGPVLTTTRSSLSVTMAIGVTEADDFEVDDAVTIELADESTVGGRVAEVGSVVPATNAQEAPTVEIVIEVVSADDEALVEGPVTIVSTGEEIVAATVVPTRSLVALAEGGFAVERVTDDGQSALVGIEIGTFDDGVVEVIDGALEPGDTVVVPR